MKIKRNIYNNRWLYNFQRYSWMILSQYLWVLLYAFVIGLLYWIFHNDIPKPKNNIIESILIYTVVLGPFMMFGFSLLCVFLGTWYFRSLVWVTALFVVFAIPVLFFSFSA